MAAKIALSEPFAIGEESSTIVYLGSEHDEPAMQMEFGGTTVVVEYDADNADLVRALYRGISHVDEVFAALSLFSGVGFGKAAPVQLLEITPNVASRRLLVPVLIATNLSNTALGADAVDFVQKAVLHWNGLDAGRRLRRAALKYSHALSTPDAADAFRLAYVGLEVLEKPLANEFDIPAGVEVVPASCHHCGKQYSYKKTALVAVKKYVTEGHDGAPTDQRTKDWKECSSVRHDLAHGLKDLSEIEQRAQQYLPAIMHYLHDACVHLVHAHDLESQGYQIARPNTSFIVGELHGHTPGPIQDAHPLLHVRSRGWARDAEYGLLPEFSVENPSRLNVELFLAMLVAPLSVATEANLSPMGMESGPQDPVVDGKTP